MPVRPGPEHEPVSDRANRRPPYLPGGRLARRPWVRRLGTAVAVLLTLVAGQAIIRTEPDFNSTQAPFYFKGEPGDRVTAGDVAVTLLGVRGAAKAGPEGGYYADTAGVWIIVKVRLEAIEQSIRTGYVALADPEGRTFRATGRFKQPLGENKAELRPGIPTEGEIAFEVPQDDGVGLTLRIGSVGVDVGGGKMSAYTDIRVPVDDSDVSRWLKDPAPAAIGKPKVGG